MMMFACTAIGLTALVIGAAVELPSPLFVTYWGQGSSSLQKPLRAYCDMGYNVVVLGFINKFGNETFNMQMDSVPCSTNDNSGCAAVKNDISYCQNKGIKILVSMGGATVHDCGEGCGGEYRLDSIGEANKTAETMYNMFFGGANHASPFGGVQLDGVDLDIENNGEQYFYDKFAEKLRELQWPNELIISAAPECKHGCPFSCNPLEQTVGLTVFDYLFVQFYNDESCSLLGPDFNSSLDYWLNLPKPNSDVLVVLGVPGDSKPWDVTNETFFVQPEQVVSIYSYQHAKNNRVGGIGIWQASSNSTAPGFFPIIQSGLGLSEGSTTISSTPTRSSTSLTTAAGSSTTATSSSKTATGSSTTTKTGSAVVSKKILLPQVFMLPIALFGLLLY